MSTILKPPKKLEIEHMSATRLIRFSLVVGTVMTVLSAGGESPTNKLRIESETKRQMLPGFHQEFEGTRHIKTASADQVSHREVIIDVSQIGWREQSRAGSGDVIRIFDGQDVLVTESGGTEYMRAKRNSGNDPPMPEPYGALELDWGKAKEIARFPGKDHTCIVIEGPIKARFRSSMTSKPTRMLGGNSRILIGGESGVWVGCHSVELIEDSRVSYQVDLTYSLKRMSYGAAPTEGLFKLPESGVREVKELTPWNQTRIKRELVGKLAPELEITDIQGNPISLSALKGKTVLLDFWTTW